MNRMPSGQYIPNNSIIHRLDARIKIVGFIILLAAVIQTNSLPGYLFIFTFTGILTALSKIGFRAAVGSVKNLFLFFILIFLMNTVFYSSSSSLWTWWIFHMSLAGMKQGGNVVLHVILLIIYGNIMTGTTSPMEITSALAKLLEPVKYLRIPVDDVAMILSIAIQFIPTLLEETELIRKAQIARGAKFESKHLKDKALSMMPLVIPIFLTAFKRADELSLAMEARGYRGAGNRTKKSKKPLSRQDFVAAGVYVLICCTAIFVF